MAHYNLALNYWHLRDYAEALRHARTARALGIVQAAGIEQALIASRGHCFRGLAEDGILPETQADADWWDRTDPGAATPPDAGGRP